MGGHLNGPENPCSTAWISGRLYSDGDGRIFTFAMSKSERIYLTEQQWSKRRFWDWSLGNNVRVRVKARRQVV